MTRPPKSRATAQDIATEIIRRAAATGGKRHIIRLSAPPAGQEILLLWAARLERRPIMVMPHKCATMAEWLDRYGTTKDTEPASR
jgi:hypothetical protein